MLEWAAILKFLKKVWPYIAGVALLIGAYLYVDSKGYERAQTKYKAEISEIKAASAQSEAAAWKQKAETEQRYAEQANKADEAVADLRSELNTNLLRFAQAQRASGNASASPASNTASGSNGPGESPQLPYDIPDDAALTITYGDAKVCSENTSRLQAVRNWGLSILADQSKESPKPPSPTPTN